MFNITKYFHLLIIYRFNHNNKKMQMGMLSTKKFVTNKMTIIYNSNKTIIDNKKKLNHYLNYKNQWQMNIYLLIIFHHLKDRELNHI